MDNIIAANNLTQQVNRIGRYLYNHIDSAYRYKASSNTSDVYMTVMYQLPVVRRPIGDQEVHEMHIIISVTTYADKIRVNLIEISPDEITLGHMAIPQDMVDNLDDLKKYILARIQKLLNKRYANYDFIY